jgi:hypothetical protein
MWASRVCLCRSSVLQPNTLAFFGMVTRRSRSSPQNLPLFRTRFQTNSLPP